MTWQIQMFLSPKNNALCTKVLISYNAISSLKNNGVMNTYDMGTAGYQKALLPEKDGNFTLSLYCTKRVNIIVNRVSLLVPHIAQYY